MTMTRERPRETRRGNTIAMDEPFMDSTYAKNFVVQSKETKKSRLRRMAPIEEAASALGFALGFDAASGLEQDFFQRFEIGDELRSALVRHKDCGPWLRVYEGFLDFD